MHELTGDIWEYLGEAVIAITTNGSLTRDGRAVLGRGCARQAREHFPGLPQLLGRLILAQGNHVHDLGNGLLSSLWRIRPGPCRTCGSLPVHQSNYVI
jgi:hypothetical protein